MTPLKKTSDHSRSCQKLAEKCLLVERMVNPYLEASNLQGIGIYISQIDLADSEHFPEYFLPATQEKLASLEDRRPELPSPPQPGDFNDYSGRRPRDMYYQAKDIGDTLEVQLQDEKVFGTGMPGLLDSTKWKSRGYGFFYYTRDRLTRISAWYECENGLIGSEESSPKDFPQKWRLASLFDTFNNSRPHTACVSHHGVENIGPLLRSEVLVIGGTIIDRMCLKWSRSHHIFPVLMISMIGSQGRIIQAHYDGDKLYIRYSRLYEFKGYDRGSMDLFLRWLMNEPVGDTTVQKRGNRAAMASISQSLLKCF